MPTNDFKHLSVLLCCLIKNSDSKLFNSENVPEQLSKLIYLIQIKDAALQQINTICSLKEYFERIMRAEMRCQQ